MMGFNKTISLYARSAPRQGRGLGLRPNQVTLPNSRPLDVAASSLLSQPASSMPERARPSDSVLDYDDPLDGSEPRRKSLRGSADRGLRLCSRVPSSLVVTPIAFDLVAFAVRSTIDLGQALPETWIVLVTLIAAVAFVRASRSWRESRFVALWYFRAYS
jgi:hypothetical protein